MIRVFVPLAAAAFVAACQPAIPDSGVGVGLTRAEADQRAAAARDAQLAGTAPAEPLLTSPSAIAEQALEADAAQDAAAQNSGISPVDASPSNPAPTQVASTATTDGGFSREQDFDAVSNRRSIEDDAERLAAARAQYVIIEPSDLPTRAGSNVPNIVEFAIRTNNPVGAQVYRRSGFSNAARTARNCAAYASDDIAQEEFLLMGGPQRDRKRLDPDGDGFACNWNPTPFRRAVQATSGG